MNEPYLIAEGLTISELERAVAQYIAQGYVPLGGVCSRQPDGQGKTYLCQAVVLPKLISK